MFVARIHNQILNSCFPVDNWDKGIKGIRKIIQEEELPFSDDDSVRLNNNGEYFNDSDPDNFLTLRIIPRKKNSLK